MTPKEHPEMTTPNTPGHDDDQGAQVVSLDAARAAAPRRPGRGR